MSDDKHFIRLVSEAPIELGDVDAIEAAKVQWTKAKDAQVEVVTNLYATKLLARRANVNHTYLKSVRREAIEQVERARAVLDAVERCMAALEAVKR